LSLDLHKDDEEIEDDTNEDDENCEDDGEDLHPFCDTSSSNKCKKYKAKLANESTFGFTL